MIIFAFSFPTVMPRFFLLSIALANSSKIMLRKSDDKGYPCFVAYFTINASSVFPLSMMLFYG